MTENEIAAIREEFRVYLTCSGAQGDHLAYTVPVLLREIEALQQAIDDIQEYVVRHAFDTSVGRRIDEYITARLQQPPANVNAPQRDEGEECVGD